MNRDQIQELVEGFFIAALDGGGLASKVFRMSDVAERCVADMIVVQCGPPERRLDGPGGYDMVVEIETRTKTPTANAAIHGEMLDRLEDFSILKAAALSVDMTEDDFLQFIDEEMSGDRRDTRKLRVRSISMPIRLWLKDEGFEQLLDELDNELTDELDELLIA